MNALKDLLLITNKGENSRQELLTKEEIKGEDTTETAEAEPAADIEEVEDETAADSKAAEDEDKIPSILR